MKLVRVRNRSRPETPTLDVAWCDSFFCRLRGLMFRHSLPPDWGLLLVQPRESRLDAAIHMLWMRMDLAVIWLNSHRVVVDARPAYRWRSFLMPGQPAQYILETSLKHLDRFRIGEKVDFEEIPAN